MVRPWLTAPRRLLALFLATGTLLVCTFLWLGWQLARQDRELEAQRLQERRETAADLAVAALRRAVEQTERRLESLSATLGSASFERDAAALAGTLTPDAVLIAARSGSLTAYPDGRLPYYPDAAIGAPPPSSVFAEADALEFRANNHAGALAALARLARDRDPAIRAAALGRMAVVHRRQRQWQVALDVYRDLEALHGARLEGVPADLAARHARLDLLLQLQRTAEARSDAAAIRAGLRNGRWRLTRGAYEFYAAEADRIPESPAQGTPDGDRAARLALAGVVAAATTVITPGPTSSLRHLERAGDVHVLLLVRTAADGAVALALGPRWMADQLTAPGGPLAAAQGVAVGLTDPDGHPVRGLGVGGTAANGSAAPSIRIASATGLPWNLHAVTSDAAPVRSSSAARQRLIAVGLAAVTLLFIAGFVLIGRAVSREMAVSRQQSDFVAAVSHEFRTPLSSLCLCSELLEAGRVADDAERIEYYGVMARESRRLRRLVDGLLNFGRMEAGAMPYRFETIDPIEVAREVCDQFRRDLTGKGFAVELATHEDVPLMSADRAALACALWNLLDNAVKYSPECRTVWVEVAGVSGGAVFRVRDRGTGIPAPEQARIFDKFVRGRAAAEAGTVGTGVGLALVRHIVDAHGGDIRLDSAPGEGSTFTIVVPTPDRRDSGFGIRGSGS